MNIIFILFIFIFIIIFPSIFLFCFLYLISKIFIKNLTFEYCGYFKYKNINFYINSLFYFINIHIDYFQLKLIWIKFRIKIKGFKITINLKNDFLIFDNKKIIRKNSFVISRNNNINNENSGMLNEIKKQFYNIIEEKFIIEYLFKKENNINYELNNEYIKKIINNNNFNKKNMILRNLLTLIDFIFEDENYINLKLSENNYFHQIKINKIFIKIIKGLNLHKEIHFIIDIFGMNINEFQNVNNNYNNDYIKYNLIGINEINLNLKLEYGLLKIKNKNFNNTLNIKINFDKIYFNFSIRMINIIFNLLTEIIKYNKYFENNNNNNNDNKMKDIKFKIICIEENIINIIINQLKKIKIRIFDLNINLLNDNNKNILSSIYIENIIFTQKNYFNTFYDRNKITLLENNNEFKLNNIIITNENNNKIILQIPYFKFNGNKNVIYFIKKMEGNILNEINIEIPKIDVLISSKNLEPFLIFSKLILNNIKNIENINETFIVNNNNNYNNFYDIEYKENSIEENKINIIINNSNFVVFDEKFYFQFFNSQIFIAYFENYNNNNLNKETKINFTPIKIDFFNIETLYFSSNIIINNLKILISEDKNKNIINVFLNKFIFLIYDDMLINIVKLISEIIMPFLSFNNNNNINNNKNNNNNNQIIKLNLNDIKILFYTNLIDLFTIKTKQIDYIIDNKLIINNIKLYHQNLDKIFYKKKNIIINIINYSTLFNNNLNLISIKIDEIFFNFLLFNLIYPLITILNFINFLPDWIEYNFNTKFKLKKELNFNKDDKNNLNIDIKKIIININKNSLSNCGILQTNPEKLSSKLDEDKDIIYELLKLKNNYQQFKIEINNFSFKNNNIIQSNFNKIIISNKFNINFKEINTYFESNKFINFNNISIKINKSQEDSKFNFDNLISIISVYKENYAQNYEFYSIKNLYNNFDIMLNDINFILNDIKIIDKCFLFFFDFYKYFQNFPYINCYIFNYNEIKKNENNIVNILINNFNSEIYCLLENNEIFNIIKFGISSLILKNTENNIKKNIDNNNIDNNNIYNIENKIEISCYYFYFGINNNNKELLNSDLNPILIVPIIEINIENSNIIRINIPQNCLNKIKYVDNNNLINNYNQENNNNNDINNFILNTQSFTLLFNYDNLDNILNIIDLLYKRSFILKQYLINKYKNNNNSNKLISNNSFYYNNSNFFFNDSNEYEENFIDNNNNNSFNKIILSIFNIKIIYLIQKNNEYDNLLLKFKKKDIKNYFGFISRFYSINLKYNLNNEINILEAGINLFNLVYITKDNLFDEKFFIYDSDRINYEFNDLQNIKNFNDFFEINSDNKNLLINNFIIEEYKNIFEYNNYNNNNNIVNMNNINDSLIKIFDIHLKHEINKVLDEDLNIYLNKFKLLWNKLNTDIFNILILNDILKIIDKILNIFNQFSNDINNNNNNNITNNNINIESKFNFIFEIINLQFSIENEITNSKILLATRKKGTISIKKLSFNEKSKNFELKVLIQCLNLYIPPSNNDNNNNNNNNNNNIFWIGNPKKNSYYLNIENFIQMCSIPNIEFTITEIINNNNNNNNIETITNITITIPELLSTFKKSSFSSFINCTRIFIFDRGNTYLQEKLIIDNRDEDLKKYSMSSLKSTIKSLISNTTIYNNEKKYQKKINFIIQKIEAKLLKEKKNNNNKEIIKLNLKNFEGFHIIYFDKSSETNVNVFDLIIEDCEKNNIILEEYLIDNKNNILNEKDRIEMIRFREKDSYVGKSNWYVLNYLEIGIMPLKINVSKEQCDFVLEFFFDVDSNSIEDDNNNNNNNESDDEKIVINNNKNNDNNKEFPLYFKNFKINETKLYLSYYFSEGSRFNLKNAKVKFKEFYKKEKFYTFNIMINRFVYHLKLIGLQNLGHVISSILFDNNNNNENEKKIDKIEEEKKQKKILFGKNYK